MKLSCRCSNQQLWNPSRRVLTANAWHEECQMLFELVWLLCSCYRRKECLRGIQCCNVDEIRRGEQLLCGKQRHRGQKRETVGHGVLSYTVLIHSIVALLNASKSSKLLFMDTDMVRTQLSFYCIFSQCYCLLKLLLHSQSKISRRVRRNRVKVHLIS